MTTTLTVPSALLTPCCSLPPIGGYSIHGMGWWRKPDRRPLGWDHDLTIGCRCGRWWSLPPAVVQAATDDQWIQSVLMELG